MNHHFIILDKNTGKAVSTVSLVHRDLVHALELKPEQVAVEVSDPNNAESLVLLDVNTPSQETVNG